MEKEIYRTQPTLMAVAVSTAILALSGCASSGGSSSNGGGGNDDQGDEVGEQWPAEPQGFVASRDFGDVDEEYDDLDEEDVADVQVTVVDDYIRKSHKDFEGQLVEEGDGNPDHIVQDDDAVSDWDFVDGDAYDHGTPVASLIAGRKYGVSGDATLHLVDRYDEEGQLGRNVRGGIKAGAEAGSDVINVSFGPAPDADEDGNPVGPLDKGVLADRVADDVIENDVVVVESAGNAGIQRKIGDLEDEELLNHIVLVGGVGYDGQRHPQSNYPGDDERTQDRWIVADYHAGEAASGRGDEGTTRFSGTSVAAPVISGKIATLISVWPHLGVEEEGDDHATPLLAAQRLLDTADCSEGSTGYESETKCNEELGQGIADLEAAMAPEGEVKIVAAGAVESDGASDDADEGTAQAQSVTDTYASWSHAFGNGLPADSELFEGAVGFDELGRDYAVDLSGAHRGNSLQADVMRQRMQSHLSNAGVGGGEMVEIAEGIRMDARHTDSGELLTGRFDMDFGGTRVSAFGFQGGEENPMETVLEGVDTAMLSSTTPQFTHSLDDVAGVTAEVGLTEMFSVSAEYWSGRSDEDPAERVLSEDTVGLSDYGVDRQDIALHMQATDELRLSLGQGMLREDNGMLGSRGYGALNLGDEHELHVTSLGAEYAVSDRLSVTGQYEYGQGRMDGGAGMIRSIDNLRTEQATLGVAWDGDDHQVAFMANQPMRVTGGEIQASVPVGRTVDGEVVREDRTASIGTEGRQMDIELGYSFMPDRDSRFNANLLYMDQPNHDPNASGEWAGAVTYAVRF
ncbi:S8 family serine peptidase [Thioalkalivibrio sp. ALE19]|uniref:S8 family serine peptidase n=1 Tax=Thioalkalivibrio sp. ALE19 TaxID=1266909 RepID=UPI001E52DA43|nr:S8 family serine peptidase [Thioalkalivibrio sp. ALE19]